MQVDFDPSVISYEELLAVFLSAHSATASAYSRQYASLIHYHDEAQRAAAVKALAAHEALRGRPVATEIVSLGPFYLAEDYHQKYQLRQAPAVEAELEAIYPDYRDLANSTAAMRINAYAGGFLPPDGLAAEAASLGLSPAAVKELAAVAGQWYR